MPAYRDTDEAGPTAARPVAVPAATTASGAAAAGVAGPGKAAARRAPLALAASVTTAWAALVSFTPVLVVVGFAYALDSTGDPINRVVRMGLAGWLLAHGVPLETGIGQVGLIPLTATVLAAWRVARAGVHTARAIGARRGNRTWGTLRAGFGVGVAYAGIGMIAAASARVPGLVVPVPRAGLTLGVFGLVAGLAGAAVEAGLLARLVRKLSPVVRDGIRTGLVATLLVLGAGAAAAGTALAYARVEASEVFAAYHTGVVGQAGLTLVCLLYGPSAAIWAASYLIGPGFVIGAGTTVSMANVSLGPVPALPALAALPSGSAPSWASLLLGVPLAAGMAAGWLLVRRSHNPRRPGPGQRSWPGLLGSAALAGPVAGLLLGLASLAAAGPLGAGRMATIGPRALPVALIATGVVAAGALLGGSAGKLVMGVWRKDA